MLKIVLNGDVLRLDHEIANGAQRPTNHYFKDLGVTCSLGDGDIYVNCFVGGGVEKLMGFSQTNEALVPYIENFVFDCELADGIKRQVGRYKFGSASGRITQAGEKYILYLSAQKLHDLKALVLKIEDGEIWPYKIPQKEHIAAFKFYRKTYGMPAFLFIVSVLLTWLIVATMKDEVYLYHVKNHNTGCVLMVQSMWGVITASFFGSYWVYAFAKDIRPVLRMIFGIIIFLGILWFVGCIYYGMIFG